MALLGIAVATGDPYRWTILQRDGPNHLGLRHNALPAHQMALITSDCAPSRLVRPIDYQAHSCFSDSYTTTAGEPRHCPHLHLQIGPPRSAAVGNPRGCRVTRVGVEE